MISHTSRIAPSHIALAAALGLAVTATPAIAEGNADEAAEDAAQPAGGAAQVEDDLHNRQSEDNIIVSASGLRELDVLAGTNVLEAPEIQREAVTGQIGELLTKIPGVSATSFAPGASRPVSRGGDALRRASARLPATLR